MEDWSWIYVAASMWTARRLESSRTWSRLELRSRRIRRWGCNRVCGTPMTGQPEVGWWRPIGPTHRSPRLTGISTKTRAFGCRDSLLVGRVRRRPPTTSRGSRRSWIPTARENWTGSRRTTWSTTTAPMRSDFLRGCLRNVMTLPRFWIVLMYDSFVAFTIMADIRLYCISIAIMYTPLLEFED